MGSPVSPIVANLYMEEVECRALNSFEGITPSHWFRYIDDTWVKIKTKEVQALTEHINSVDRNIKFTREDVKDNSLPFLDCVVQRRKDRRLHIGVYRKPTHTQTNTYFLTHTTHWNTSLVLSGPCNTELITHPPAHRPKGKNAST